MSARQRVLARAAACLIPSLLVVACTGAKATQVVVTAVTRADVAEVVDAPGTVQARASTTITSPADGTVTDVLVKDGQVVRRGEVLVRLTSPQAQERLRQALATAAGASAAGAGPLAAGAVASARATVDALTVRAPIAGTVTLGGGSDAPAAGPDLSGLLSQLPLGQATAGGAGPAPQTSIDVVEAGAPVAAGTPLVTVTDLSRLSVLADVDETDVLLVEPGVAATVQVEALPGTTYAGTVSSVGLAPSTSARGGVSYRVRVTLTASSQTPAPRPGMSAVVGLQVRSATGVLSVPSSAIVREDGRDAVFVVSDGRARLRPVEIGASGTDLVEVRSGVTEGARVVVRDGDRLRDGQAVRTRSR